MCEFFQNPGAYFGS